MRDFVRVSAGVPTCRVGDFQGIVESVLSLWTRAHESQSSVLVLPELCLSCYTSRDLLLDRVLLDAVSRSLSALISASSALSPLLLVGLPLETPLGLYNVAAAVQRGKLLGLVPKSFIPTYREFEERRWFRPGSEVPPGSTATAAGWEVPFGTDIVLRCEEIAAFGVGVEICEDMWVQVQPSMRACGAGASVVCNLSASDFTVGKAETRRLLARAASERGKCAYVYVAAGPGESSTDLAFDSDAFVCEMGSVIAQGKRFSRSNELLTVDVDLESIAHERRALGTFGDCAASPAGGAVFDKPFRTVKFHAQFPSGVPRREINPHPFVPSDPATLAARAWETFEVQVNALVTRMRSMTTADRSPRLVLGVSGGLDSTQAALVCASALDLISRPRTDLLCITMPGFGTTGLTRSNAESLAKCLGCEFVDIPISEASRCVLEAMGHPSATCCKTAEELVERVRQDPRLGDISLENVQARMRTLLLMCLANRKGGIVVGTGDLSEKALGWSTYSGDHISMYDVNAGVPKTLIKFVIRWVANERASQWSQAAQLRETLFSILDTPISPELLPTGSKDTISQLTEGALGPYELHDFCLYHFVRHGRSPARILDLARVAFGIKYSAEELRSRLRLFVDRFFRNQFKRSCATDGPKVGSVALSPRGDWRMPSDASAVQWLAEIDAYDPKEAGFP